MTLDRRWSRVALVGLLVGCSGGTEPPDPPDDPPATQFKLAVTATLDSQPTGPVLVGTTLRVTARVMKEPTGGGTPVPASGTLVNFVVVTGGGSVFAGSTISDSSGYAKEIWTLGNAAGDQVLEVRAVNQTTGDPITYDRIEAKTKLPPKPNTLWIDGGKKYRTNNAVCSRVSYGQNCAILIDADMPTPFDSMAHVIWVDSTFDGSNVDAARVGEVQNWTIESLTWTTGDPNQSTLVCNLNNTNRVIACPPSENNGGTTVYGWWRFVIRSDNQTLQIDRLSAAAPASP